MAIMEVDFNNLIEVKKKDSNNNKVIPVLLRYGNEYFQIISKGKEIESAWKILIKIIYYKFNISNYQYIDKIKNEVFYDDKKTGIKQTIFTSIGTENNSFVKFSDKLYVYYFNKTINNLNLINKIRKENNLEKIKIYATNITDIDNDDFNKEIEDLKMSIKKNKKSIKFKKANLVVAYINRIILSDEEKLSKYVRDQFYKKNLIGDIILNEQHEELLKEFMINAIYNFDNGKALEEIEDDHLFALGLVRFSMKYYNSKGKGDFWSHFKEEFNVTIKQNKQSSIHDFFEKTMKKYDMVYESSVSQKIDNITMHSFVADHSANVLLDYLFDFWRIHLSRNIANLDTSNYEDSPFDKLIKIMSSRTQDVMSHTSLLLTFEKIIPSFKNRIKRIIKLMNEAFWNDIKINETGNRINHLLNKWILDSNGAFKKEKEYVKKHHLKNKGEVLLHSPVLKINHLTNTLNISFPQQLLINCNEEDRPYWLIKCSNLTNDIIVNANEKYKKDKISYYIEKMEKDIPLTLILCEIDISLMSNDKVLSSYRINKSDVRLFDSDGKCIDYDINIIPEGNTTSYSNSELYPEVLGETNKAIRENDLFIKTINCIKGQIIILNGSKGLQVGQKLTEGLTEVYPIYGAKLVYENKNFDIYSKLPKLIFKASSDELAGVSLVINKIQNKVVDNKFKSFKIADELNDIGYVIDLNDYISKDGIYNIILSYPKYHKQKNIASLAYIKGFNYYFEDAPYIFKENAKIVFEGKLPILDELNEEQLENINASKSSFTFNYVDEHSEFYCYSVFENKLKVNYLINMQKYPIYFNIPAFYWKYKSNDEWNTQKPNDLLLKRFKDDIQRLYVDGPFDFTKAKIVTSDDVDIAEEESEINITNQKNNYFEIEKVYNWFRNDRSVINRKLFLLLDNKKIDLLNVICRSRLNSVILQGDFEKNLLIGTLDIDGNEQYTVTIKYNGNVICENEQVIDNQFSIESKLESGVYEISVYETIEDDDGFDFQNESILLNEKPIHKKIINLLYLQNQKIKFNGYQDCKHLFSPVVFSKPYFLTNFERISYEFLEDKEVYGIWNENIDMDNKNQLNSFIYYKAKLQTKNKYDYDTFLMDVIVLFPQKMKLESMIIICLDDEAEYGNLIIDLKRRWILTNYNYNNLNKYERFECIFLCDDQYFYLLELVEE